MCPLGYVSDPVYGWAEECSARFGTHPVQICTGWNTVAHLVDTEGRRASCQHATLSATQAERSSGVPSARLLPKSGAPSGCLTYRASRGAALPETGYART